MKYSITYTNIFLLLFIVMFLSFMYVSLPVFAHEVGKSKDQSIVINLDIERDYQILLSTLFGEVEESINKTSPEYARYIDVYRNRVARQIEQNLVLVNLIEEYSITTNQSVKYADEILEIHNRVEGQKLDILPIIESDAYLSKAIKYKYDLYGSFVQKVFGKIGDSPLVELNKLREEVFVTHTDLATLYLILKN